MTLSFFYCYGGERPSAGCGSLRVPVAERVLWRLIPHRSCREKKNNKSSVMEKRVRIRDQVVATFLDEGWKAGERDVCFGNFVLFAFKVLESNQAAGREKMRTGHTGTS